MLQKLIIKNYALIKELNIEPHAGLNTITGETGAGKSIMLGAVGLLLGKRADTKVLYQDNEKCVVEGSYSVKNYKLSQFFDNEGLDYEEDCIIRREINPAGKSRAFVNDTPVTLDILKTLGAHLMDVHSQHQTLLLSDQNFQLQLIDAYVEAAALKEEFQAAFSEFRTADKNLKKYKADAQELQQAHDFNQFLFDELDKANLQANEQEQLEERLKVLENGEFIQDKLAQADTILLQAEFSANNSLHEALEALKAIKSFNQTYTELFDRFNSSFIEIQDISQAVEQANNQFEHDPKELAIVQERINLIYNLQQKHQVNDISGLLAKKEELDDKLAVTQNAEGHLAKLEAAALEKKAALDKLGNTLTHERKNGFKPLEAALLKLLADLGMADASIKIDHKSKPADSTGFDDIDILFSANKGIAPQPLRSVASGGEFSRLMFTIKYVMADKVAMPTIIFDEIDTGISGEIALKMVNMMLKMAENHQVITISHLPQIAAKGQKHYFVYKDNSAEKSVSKIKLLDNEDRIRAIAEMIGGEQPTDSAIKSAEELLTS